MVKRDQTFKWTLRTIPWSWWIFVQQIEQQTVAVKLSGLCKHHILSGLSPLWRSQLSEFFKMLNRCKHAIIPHFMSSGPSHCVWITKHIFLSVFSVWVPMTSAVQTNQQLFMQFMALHKNTCLFSQREDVNEDGAPLAPPRRFERKDNLCSSGVSLCLTSLRCQDVCANSEVMHRSGEGEHSEVSTVRELHQFTCFLSSVHCHNFWLSPKMSINLKMTVESPSFGRIFPWNF